MMLNNEIKISLDKSKLRFMVFLAFLFVIAGVWFITEPTKLITPLLPSRGAVIAVGVLSIAFAGICLVIIFQKIGDRNPGLVINADGITDNSSGVSTGLIPWSVIEQVTTARVKNQPFILLHVTDGEQRIAAERNAMKRQLMKINRRMYGTPVCISTGTLQCSFDELYRIINDSFERHKESER